ncbi:hypothetical protein [Pectobacterium sp. A5351]|uniref:hypothetical protein n=1 Tax=Pectobacterium sp. A5351 TaxID=2914983 RepID=UPI00232BDCF1|nr:hypothetical protein [Pectobacterium sp. A5351]WCG83797.1 hypothetical protein O1Q74_03610 [Pectobacterium sp. A5351]
MANNDYQALLSSAHKQAFNAACLINVQTLNQCRALIRQSLDTGVSLHTAKQRINAALSGA